MRYLEEATDIARRKWEGSKGWWRVGLVILIVLGVVVGLLALAIWAFGRLIRVPGGTRNLDLYFPARRSVRRRR